MTELTFSNSEIRKITDAISKSKKWSFDITSDDGKISWNIINNIKKSKIDVIVNNKFVDDYPYDLTEKDDAYATVLNVLDYLTNIVNKYNKRNVVRESKEIKIDDKILPNWKIEDSAKELQEAISKGMLKAYSSRMKEADVHYTCKECNTNIPKYRGSYPDSCPNCGNSLKAMKESDKDEVIWGGPFKRGEVVNVKLEDPNEFYDATLITYNVADNTYGARLESGNDIGKIIQNIKTSQIK